MFIVRSKFVWVLKLIFYGLAMERTEIENNFIKIKNYGIGMYTYMNFHRT